MVNKVLRVHVKLLIEPMGIGDGDTMKVDNAMSFQSPRRSPTDIPDVCKHPVVPHSFPKGFFIKIMAADGAGVFHILAHPRQGGNIANPRRYLITPAPIAHAEHLQRRRYSKFI